MKALFLIATLLLVSCGGASGPCASSPVVGSWTNSGTTETIIVTAACAFTSDICASSGTVTLPSATATSGTGTVSITSGGAPGCLTVGDHSCAYVVQNNTQLSFTCDGGATVVYERD